METVSPNIDKHTQDIALLTSHSETYCDDLNCGCHTDVEYHAKVTGLQQHSEEEVRSAFEIFGVVVQ